MLILCGSVYLILATNIGHPPRASWCPSPASFGWLFLMGIVWTIYGIGYKGPAPSWKVLEVNVGDIRRGRHRTSPAPLPEPERAARSGRGPRRQRSAAGGVPRPTSVTPRSATWSRSTRSSPTSSQAQTGEWYLLPTSDKAVGETQAVVAEDLGPEGRNLFAATTDYTILEVYTDGRQAQA